MDLIKVTAEVELLSTANGGREKPVRTGYSPNHRFDSMSYYIGRIDFDDEEWHAPGTRSIATIDFVPSPRLRERLQPGFAWDITEGAHVVGRAVLLTVGKS